MSKIYYRKRGTSWEYRFSIGMVNGSYKQISKSGFATKKDAIAAGTVAMKEFNSTGIAFTPSELALSDYLQFWLDTISANLNDTTVANYQKKIKNYIIPKLGKYKIKSLNTAGLQKYFNDLHKTGLARNTLTVVKGILSSSLNYAVEPMKYIQSNPMDHVKLPAKRNTTVVSNEKPHVFIPEDDIKKIFERFPEGSSPYIPMMFGYKCGLRLGEAFAVRWDDIDFDKKKLSVQRQVQWHGGNKEDNSNGYWYYAPPKYNSYRIITIDDELIELLKREKEKQNKAVEYYGERYVHNYETPDGIHNCSDGKIIYPICVRECGDYITPRTMLYTSEVIHKMGISFSFHSLRHTHCSNLLTAGAKPKYVQERLGHKNIQVTMDIYQHLTQGMNDEGDEILNTLFVNSKHNTKVDN